MSLRNGELTILNPKTLALLERGRTAIAEAKASQDFRALKDIRDKSQAVFDYLRKQHDSANGAGPHAPGHGKGGPAAR